MRERGTHVLVVDDSPPVRARLSTMLRESRQVAVVHEAGCADEALERLLAHTEGARDDLSTVDRAEPIGVVVLDLHLPGQHGLALLPRIARSAPRPVIVVLTNDASEAHRRECIALGADFFFDKSRQFARVLEVLDDLEAARARYR